MQHDYEVGYGKPPKATRFVKGNSGNPRGRPRRKGIGPHQHRSGRTHLKDEMLEVLQQRVDFPERGRKKRITIQRAMIKGLVGRAIKGDSASHAQIWRLFKHYSLDKKPNKHEVYYRRPPTVLKWYNQARNKDGEELVSDKDMWRAAKTECLPNRANIMDDLLLELQEKITITEGGRSKKITKQRALLMSLVDQSIRGKTAAFNLFWAMVQHYKLDQEPDQYLESTILAPAIDEDAPVIRAYAQKHGWPKKYLVPESPPGQG